MIDLAKARALCEAQYGAKSDPEVFRAAALDLLPEALDALEQVRAVCVTITTALKQAIVERDPLKAEVERLTQSDRNVILALKAENTRLASVLEKIAYAGSDCPPARELEAFYRSQLHYCIGTAARALTPAAGGDDV